MKVGILYICTGKYSIFWKDFYLSCEKNFLKNSEKHYFVFTDNLEIDFEKENPRIHRIYQDNLGWPDNTLKRYDIFLKSKEIIEKMDYLFYLNANLIILEKIKEEEFLPQKQEKLVGCLHPGYFEKSIQKYPYENRTISKAYLNKKEPMYYFAGGINGGITKDFIEVMEILNKNIKDDLNNKIIAKWHDESQWNWYLNNHLEDIKIISPAYLYPEGWSMPFKKIILIRDKNNFGGHLLIRNERVNKLKNYFSKIKGIFYKLYKKYSNLNRLFFKFKKPIISNLNNFNLEKSNLIITIAFNNIDIIKIQHLKIKENLKENFIYMIIDNSNLKNISFEIYNYCNENNIPYVKIPLNPFLNNPSFSHGQALNWTYYCVIKKLKPIFFGFIDHDIIPFRETSIIQFIKNGIWGLIQERSNRWYLWPGFCFYEYNKIKKYKLNFMPCLGLDTGGSNFYKLYKNINKNNLSKIKHLYLNINTGKKTKSLFLKEENETVEIINEWVHLMKTSNYNNELNTKNNKILEIIKICQKKFIEFN